MLRRLAALVLLTGACGAREPEGDVEVRMEFARTDGFFSAPFPSDALRQSDGRLAVRDFPNPKKVAMLGQGLSLVGRDARGFARTGGVFFQLTGPISQSGLPSLPGSMQEDANVFLVSIDATSPDYQKRRPIQVTFSAEASPNGAPNLLALLPLQGVPLRANTMYAAVVLKSLRDGEGKLLRASAVMQDLAAGRTPNVVEADRLLKAMLVLNAMGLKSSSIAGLTVFTTDDPVGGFRRAVDDALALPKPVPAAFARTDTYADYCMYRSTITLPVFQEGTPPFSMMGGRWATDSSGKLVKQRDETARVFVSVPRKPMPPGGYPVVVMLRTGSGTDRGLDRGVRDAMGNVLVPGDGPAVHFARVGWAGLSFDGPHGGMRNVSAGDEQFLVFNVFNPPALRDNVRQSALETVLMARVLEDISFDASDCPGAGGMARFNVSLVALMGHSMGASIAPLAAAVEPRYRALILSGAGGSWIANAVDKLKPLATKASLEVLFDYPQGVGLTPTDPTLTLVQWAPEAADSQVYAEHLVNEPLVGAPRHVLMFQGIVDHYIMPSIANTMTLATGLDLAGPAHDETVAELATHPKVRDMLPFSGRAAISLPAKGNRDGVTAVVVQHVEDGVEDGHEVMFQLEAAKAQYRRFLETLAAGGMPEVP